MSGPADSCPVCSAPLEPRAEDGSRACSQCVYRRPPGDAPLAAEPAAARFSPEFTAEFELGPLIGAGAAGEVYRARQRALNRDVVVKFALATDAASLARFAREGKVLARLRHPAIVQVFGAGVEQGRPYLVFELVDGGDLRQRLSVGGRLPPGEAAALAVSLLDGLAAAHAAGLVHRDVKAENVILAARGGAKLADFGIASDALVTTRLTAPGTILGTPAYYAPELVTGGASTPRSDVYSAGVLLFEMLTGRLPSTASTVLDVVRDLVHTTPPRVDALVPEVGRALADVVARALAKDPRRRFPDATAFADALRPLVPGSSAAALARPPARGTPVARIAGVALAIGILLPAAIALAPRRPAPPAVLPPHAAGRDGADMVLIPAGEFLMGSDGERADEAPRRQVYLDAYYIDRLEVTNRLYRAFLRATGRPAQRSHPEAELDREDHPVVDITWQDAADYAQWAGKRLPTEAEWEKAGRGTDGRSWPWGPEPMRGERRANTRDRPYDREREALQAALGQSPDEIHPAQDDGFRLTAPVGSFPEGASPYGVLDLVGNVSELCADWYDPNYYRTAPRSNPRGPATGSQRVLRGGSYRSSPFRLARRAAAPERDVQVGFRCARSAALD